MSEPDMSRTYYQYHMQTFYVQKIGNFLCPDIAQWKGWRGLMYEFVLAISDICKAYKTNCATVCQQAIMKTKLLIVVSSTSLHPDFEPSQSLCASSDEKKIGQKHNSINVATEKYSRYTSIVDFWS